MKREINLLFLLLILLTGKGAIGQNNFFQIGDESPYIEDFEGETTSLEFFQSNNDANLWYVGTAASHGGQKGLYISNDGGNTIGYTYSSNSMAFAYVPIGVSAGNYQISYDWHHQGGDADAFLRVALAPCTPNPFWGYPGPNNFEYSRLPEYWIALDGGSGLGHSPDWTSEMARLSFQQISQYYLVFAWRNTSSSSGLDAAAIDNIRIEKVSVFVPEQPVASNISGHSATITWADPHATAWNIRYKKTNPIENEWTTINSVTQNSHTLTNLDDGTQYEVQVQAINNNQNSAWTTSALFNTDVIVSQENPYQEDFEGATLFHLVNDLRVPNRWCIGTAAHHGSGTKGLYISKDGGNTNSYSNNWTIEFAYVQLGLEGGQYEIAYDWKCIGKDQYDYMRVALVPATTNLTGGSTPSDFSYNTLPTGWIAADDGSQLCLSQEWSSKDVIVSVNENGSYYLVFAWCNKGVYPIDPPAAIDNISVSRLAVAPPTQLAVSDITFNSATITWHAPYASAWNVRYKATNQGENEWNIINSVTQDTYTLTGLDAHTQYEVQVQTTCLSGQSEWTASVIFATKNDIDYDRPYFENFEAATTFLFSESYDGNQWYIGTAACNGTGSKGLYVTKDQGASNSYWTHPLFACNVYAYVPVSLTAGLYEISYDWRNIGKLDQDYMRVALVPSTASLSSSNYVSDLSHNTLPAGWIAADGGSQLNQSQEWSSKTSGLTITNETAGDYYLVFVWHNDAANYAANPPAAVDNLSVEKVYAFTPELLTASNITANSATISWANATVTSWNLRYREAGNGSWSETIPVAQNQYTLTGLQRSINYEVQVQAVVQSGPSHWASLTFMTKNAVDFGQAYEEDFENETTLFQFANETANSKWYIGAAAHNGEGSSRGLYISNDSGNSNAYTYNTPSMVYAYVPITISSGKHEISYDWRCNGELDCDYMRVALVPATANLVGGTNAPSGFSHNSLPEGWIAADGGNQLCQSSEWSTKTERLTLTEGDYFLVFAWRNNNSIAYNPPAAVDNVHVEIVHAFTPSQLAVSDITTNSAKATWTDNDALAWNIRYKKTSDSEWNTISSVSQNPYTLTGLDSSTEYEVQVQATNTNGQSAWTASAVFNTVATYTLTYNANGATSGTVPVDPNSPYAENATVTVLGNTGTLTRTNYLFDGWNTQADGSGTAYLAGETFQISANTVLYAQWLYDMTIIDPDNLHASLITGKSATLNWSAGSNSNPTGWNLDYKLHDAQAWTNLATNLAAATTNYLLENLVVDTEYDFRVQAIFGNNTSSWVEASFSTASTIVIGEATSSTHILPTFSTSRYSLTQQIYTADEINRTGFITSIAFNCTSGSGNWRNLDIYLVQTDKSTFDDETDWIHVTEDDLHFGYRMVEFKEGWSTIELLPPFEYDGLSNLCLVVYDHTQYACPDNDRIECMTIGTGVPSGLACINSNEINPNYPPTNSSATQYHKNQLRLTFEDTPAPRIFQTIDRTPTSVTMEWIPCGHETSWELQCVADGDDWSQAQSIIVDGDLHTYTFENLEPGTWYKTRIRAGFGNDYSEWTDDTYFVTPCREEDKVPISFILRNCQGTGWNGAELYIYDSDQDYEFEPITLGNELSEQTFTINACAGDEILLYWDCGENPVPYSFDVVIEGADVLHMEEYLEHYGDYIEDFFLVEAPACSAPIDLTAEVTPEQTVLTWDGNGATEWMLAYKQIGEESWYFVDETLTDPTYTLEDLETNRYYKYQVASVCYNEELAISVPYYFYVPMCPVEEQCIYTFELDVKDGYDWWFGASLSVVDADSEEEIASLTINEGDDIPKTVALPLCQGTNIELVWYGGYSESRCGFEVFDGNGDLVASKQFDEELGYEYVFELGEVTCGSCKVPKHLQASNVGTESATLNWTPGNEETAWNLQFRPIDALTDLNDWTGIELIPLTEPFITFETLSPATSYQFRVQAVCGEEEESTWSRACKFSTFMCDPEDQCTYTIEMQDSFGDGWNGASLEVKDVETNATIASITMTGGSESSTELSLCDGRNVAFVWHKGQYDDECSFQVYDGNDNPVVSDQDTELDEGAFLIGTVNCESGFEGTSAVQVVVNGEVKATLNATVGEPIDLTPYIPAEAPTDGFEFYKWYKNYGGYNIYDEYRAPLEECFNGTYSPLEDEMVTIIEAMFCQPTGKAYLYFFSLPVDDTLVIVGNHWDPETGTDDYYGLDGNVSPTLLAFDENWFFLEEWDDAYQQHHSMEDMLWIVESTNGGFYLRHKATNRYLAISDGQLTYAADQNGAHIFHHSMDDYGNLLYFKVDDDTHIEFENGNFCVADDDDYYDSDWGQYSNVRFYSKQRNGRHFTNRIQTYGDNGYLESFEGVHVIEGDVEAASLYNEEEYWSLGLIIIRDGGVLTGSQGINNRYAEALVIEDGGQLIHRGEVVATVEKNIAGYGAGNANTRNGWNFIATPIGDGTEVSTLQTESAYDLYRYDEPSSFWLDTDENRISTLDNSTGYLYANEEDVILQFKGLLYTNSNVGKTLSCQAEGDLAGFNLIGNPYAYNLGLNDIYFDSYGDHQSIESIYVIDGTRIVVAQNDAAIVKPCEGFFVKALEDEAYFVFAPNRLGGLAYSSMPTPDLKIEVAMAERGAELLDRAYLNFNGARNVEKLVLDKNATRLSLVSEGKDYAALSASNEGTMPLNFTAAQNGIYTLTVSAERTEATYLHLLDKLTGADIDLLESGSYTFTATSSDDAMRFEIVFKTK